MVADTDQVEVLAGLTQKEALHPVLMRLVFHVMESGVTTPEQGEKRVVILYREIGVWSSTRGGVGTMQLIGSQKKQNSLTLFQFP